MYSDFKTELDEYLAAKWTTTPIYDFINKPGSAPKFDPWVSQFKPLMSTDTIQSVANGAHCILTNYVIGLSVFVGSAEGDDQAIDLSDALKKLFIGKTLPNNIVFFDVDTEYGVKSEGESSGGWYEVRMAITCDYRWTIE